MKNLTRFLYEYFYYTRRERDATFVLILFCFIFFLLPAVYSHFIPPKPKYDFSEFQAAIAAATEKDTRAKDETENKPKLRGRSPASQPVVLFQFDPNTASKNDLEKLGLSNRTAQTLINFREKGGKFKTKEDLKKVYGLRDEDYDRLENWVEIKSLPNEAFTFKPEKTYHEETLTEPEQVSRIEKRATQFEKPYEPVSIDINTATLEEWQLLSGIGPAYSKRIVKFREKLGGFASVDLVGRTYGLPDSTFQKVKPYLQLSPISRKIKINSCSLEELKKHPLISNYQATILFNYRQQHGGFAELEDLKNIKAGFEDVDWPVLGAYFSFE